MSEVDPCPRCHETEWLDNPRRCGSCGWIASASVRHATLELVQCDDNGECGPCACPCHTDVEDPGDHIATCKFADDDYVPPDFVEKAMKASGRPLLAGNDKQRTRGDRWGVS